MRDEVFQRTKLWRSCVSITQLFCLNCANGPMKKIAELEMEKLELLSSVPCSRDGLAEDVKLKTLMIFKYYQKSPEAF